jgi:hypothetical protein
MASKAFHGCPLCSLLSCGSFNTDPLDPNPWWVALALAARVGARAASAIGGGAIAAERARYRYGGFGYNFDHGYYGYNAGHSTSH